MSEDKTREGKVRDLAAYAIPGPLLVRIVAAREKERERLRAQIKTLQDQLVLSVLSTPAEFANAFGISIPTPPSIKAREKRLFKVDDTTTIYPDPYKSPGFWRFASGAIEGSISPEEFAAIEWEKL